MQIKVRQDNNGNPGEILDGATWDITLQGHGGGLSGVEEYIFYTTADCVLLEKDNYYWISLNSIDDDSQIKWAHTSGSYYNYSISHDNGESWSPSETGFAGAGKISGEAVYYPPEINYNTYDNGDVNLDGGLNVLDVVALSSFILGNIEFTTEQIEIGDFNQDGGNNILDVVALVNEILNPTTLDWTLEDINPNSNSYSQMVGPPIYLADNKITGYYFGKAGWSTCQARFGVLDYLYNELLDEGYGEQFAIMGINKYQYSGSSDTCMLCGDPDSCNNCDEARTLPWTNDIPSQIFEDISLENFEDLNDDGTSEDETATACQSFGYIWNGYEDECFIAYAAEIMDAALRDFILIDSSGKEVARINLTGYNPDPQGSGECSGNYESIKSLIIDIIEN